MSSPRLLLFKTLWGWTASLQQACSSAASDRFDGLEVNLDHPCLKALDPEAIRCCVSDAKQHLILEIVTGGDYIPDLGCSPLQHLDQIKRGLERAIALAPLKISLITGSDSWEEVDQHRFLESVLDQVDACSIPVTLETHRSRSLFDPWRMPAWLARHPRLRLTADLSHWCAVSERLMTPDLPPIQAMAGRVDHIHARIGHAQGPSVSHPFAPEWAQALESHHRCWQLFLDRRAVPECPITMTPEFGPDGYMPLHPFTAEPLADVQLLNAEMASWLRSTMLIPANPNRSL